MSVLLLVFRSCAHVDSLRHVGRGIKTTTEYKISKESLDEIIVKMKMEKDLRTRNLTTVNQQKEKLLKDVDVFQDEIIAKIKELTKSSKEQIRTKHQEYKKELERDEAALDTVIISTNKTLRNLSAYSEARVFANVKATETAVQDGETLLENMSNEWFKKEIRFSFNHLLMTNAVSLGHIPDADEEFEGS